VRFLIRKGLRGSRRKRGRKARRRPRKKKRTMPGFREWRRSQRAHTTHPKTDVTRYILERRATKRRNEDGVPRWQTPQKGVVNPRPLVQTADEGGLWPGSIMVKTSTQHNRSVGSSRVEWFVSKQVKTRKSILQSLHLGSSN